MTDVQGRRMRYYFSGIAGAGMNPLAQLMTAWGHAVQGSDRSIDQGKNSDIATRLRAQGIDIVAQDGTGVVAGIDRFVYSTAVEDDTPEMLAAKRQGIALISRPLLLAEIVNAARPGIAVAGTSGKSTITGMITWILRQAHMPATILGGAALAGEGGSGGFCAGPSAGPVVAEACEASGRLADYHPAIGVLHNISRDHAELADLHQQFDAYARQSRTLMVNANCAEAMTSAAGHANVRTYGLGSRAHLPLEIIAVGPRRALGVISLPGGGDLTIDLPQPGAHNLENAAAAAAVALEIGIPAPSIAAALATFPGIFRRFEVIGTTQEGIRVVDDYAHNGEKIRAAILAAQAGCDRLVAVFQPHGYGPARFLRPELKALLPMVLRPGDRFCYNEIFYSGGSVAKDISSRDLAADLPPSLDCAYAANHNELLTWLADTAIPGDTVLMMGARDPDLPRLARAVYELL